MGISIHMGISKSVTREEWGDVYKETLQLVKAFPLAEQREASVRGIPTRCLVRTEEREYTYGWLQEKVDTGWFANGDYEYLSTAERYSLSRELVAEEQYDEGAPDAMLASVPDYVSGYSWEDERFNQNYSLWGAKTQGEPYHMYLLAIACLIESRLGRKAYVYGDITKGQCERAVRIANEHLDQAIHTPDRCDTERLFARIDDFPLTETEKLQLFIGLYLGRKNADFGVCIRTHFSEQTCNEYWKSRFQQYCVTSRGFSSVLKDYLLWGFGLEELCSFVRFQDDDGNIHYEDFVKSIMDAKLHQRNKDCTDVLEIDPNDEEPYGIHILFAQIAFGGARNRKVDRYIPIEEIKAALLHAIGSLCPVDELINEYLERESAQELPDFSGKTSEEDYSKAINEDPSYALNKVIESKKQAFMSIDEKYDIWRSEDLPYYEVGDTMCPSMVDAVGASLTFYRGALAENTYVELMAKTPEERCLWLARENRCVLLRDKDWDRIYADIMDCPESFGRYYPMVRVRVDREGQRSILRAFVTNDALYFYALEFVASKNRSN